MKVIKDYIVTTHADLQYLEKKLQCNEGDLLKKFYSEELRIECSQLYEYSFLIKVLVRSGWIPREKVLELSNLYDKTVGKTIVTYSNKAKVLVVVKKDSAMKNIYSFKELYPFRVLLEEKGREVVEILDMLKITYIKHKQNKNEILLIDIYALQKVVNKCELVGVKNISNIKKELERLWASDMKQATKLEEDQNFKNTSQKLYYKVLLPLLKALSKRKEEIQKEKKLDDYN